MTEVEKTKILMVKTNTVCFISDCYKNDGYDYEYHRSKLTNLCFDGEKPTSTFQKNWYQISQYPSKIEVIHTNQSENHRYEINDLEIVSEKYPKVIFKKDLENYSEGILENLYTFKYDTLPDKREDVTDNYEIEVICELENFKPSNKINYPITIKHGWEGKQYTITNFDVQHQMLDKIIFPSVALNKTPSSFSSKQMFDITRQYVRDNIDNSIAKITSDHDFCFSVEKIIKLLEPKNYSYQNVFVKTKKQREKIHFGTATYKQVKVFEMTHDQRNYENYTPIQPMFANSEDELKEKVDLWLASLIEAINSPLEQCEHCNGTGYKKMPETIPANNR